MSIRGIKYPCFIMAVILTGCSSETSTKKTNYIEPSDLDSQIYLSCENFRVEYVDEGLVVFDVNGIEIARHRSKLMSRKISPRSINSGDPDCSDIIPIYDNETYGYLMPTGKLFASQLFENTAGLYENILAFKKNGKWGLINGDGYEILEPIHDKVFWFEADRWMVTNNGENFLVDMSGNRQPIDEDHILSYKYGEKFSKRSEYVSCPDGLKLQSKNGRWGMVDENNDVIITHKFRALHCFKDNLSIASNDESKTWCYINREGEYIDKECHRSHPIDFQTHYYPEEFSPERYENSVLWMRAYLDFGEARRDEPPKFVSDGGDSFGKKPIAQANFHFNQN